MLLKIDGGLYGALQIVTVGRRLGAGTEYGDAIG